jgi:hypothetical protein
VDERRGERDVRWRIFEERSSLLSSGLTYGNTSITLPRTSPNATRRKRKRKVNSPQLQHKQPHRDPQPLPIPFLPYQRSDYPQPHGLTARHPPHPLGQHTLDLRHLPPRFSRRGGRRVVSEVRKDLERFEGGGRGPHGGEVPGGFLVVTILCGQ